MKNAFKITQDITNSLLADQHRLARTRSNNIEAQYQRAINRDLIHDLVDELSIDEQE